MWKQDIYHYLPALFLLIGLLLYQRWDRQLNLPGRPIAWSFVVLAALCLGLAMILYAPWAAGVASALLCCGFLASQRDTETGGDLLYIWPLTLLWIRLPVNLDTALVSWLQHRSSQLSSFVLDMISVPHALQGNIIELPQGRLFVEEACSGVQSLFTIVFLSLAIVVYNRRRLWLLPFYLLAAVFWAGLMNVSRLTTIAYVRDRFDLDWSHGLSHQLVGYFFLGMAGLFLLSTDRLFRVIFFRTIDDKGGSRTNNPIVHSWNRLLRRSIPSSSLPLRKAKEKQIYWQRASWDCSR